MYKILIRSYKASVSKSAILNCEHCNYKISKQFFDDTPIRQIHARCWDCQQPLPDHESLIRDRMSRIIYYRTNELPYINSTPTVIM